MCSGPKVVSLKKKEKKKKKKEKYLIPQGRKLRHYIF